MRGPNKGIKNALVRKSEKYKNGIQYSHKKITSRLFRNKCVGHILYELATEKKFFLSNHVISNV